MAGTTWEPRAGRYRGPDGRFVAPPMVREAVDAVIDGGADRLAQLSQRLVAGRISLADWQRGMAMEIKDLHLAQRAAGRGGWAQLTAADYGAVGGTVRHQYAYLARFAAGIAAGTVPLDGRLITRAQLYAQAARRTFGTAAGQSARDAGATQERNDLHARDSCAGCLAATAAGWVPLGSLPGIGQRDCGPMCRCSIEYR